MKKITCIRCSGFGEVIGGWGHRYKCGSCNGTGEVEKEQDPEEVFKEPNTPPEYRECTYCCGHGKIFTDWEITCSKCKGTGKI